MQKEIVSETNDVPKKTGKKISGDKIIEEFNKLCCSDEDYSLDELKNIFLRLTGKLEKK